MKLYIHIGAHKTASTYLQECFSLNRVKLESLDILYPESWIIHWGHHRVPEMLCSDRGGEIFLEELRDIKCNYSGDLILSSENFENIEKIKHSALKVLAEEFDVIIIYYTRFFSGLSYSRWQEDVKHGFIYSFEKFIANSLLNPMQNPLVNPASVVDKYAEIFGRDKVILRSYEVATVSENIFTDFLDIVMAKEDLSQVGKSLKYPGKARSNTAANPDFIEIVRQVNLELYAAGYDSLGRSVIFDTIKQIEKENPELIQSLIDSDSYCRDTLVIDDKCSSLFNVYSKYWHSWNDLYNIDFSEWVKGMSRKEVPYSTIKLNLDLDINYKFNELVGKVKDIIFNSKG